MIVFFIAFSFFVLIEQYMRLNFRNQYSILCLTKIKITYLFRLFKIKF